MLDAATIERTAKALDDAERDQVQIRQLTLQHDAMTVEDAYAIQRAWVEMKVARGRTVRGHKIGLTSKAMQSAVNIDEPDHGVLLDDMFFQDGSEIPADRFIEPRVEVELAFLLKDALRGPALTLMDVLSATEFVVPALEIIDARVQRVDPNTRVTRKVQDTISDNAANAGVILGGRPVKPLDLDLRWVSALLYKNGSIEESGVAAAVLNHPANGVAWLARKIYPCGASLKPGEIVLAGSFTRPTHVRAGDTLHADYGPLGAISCLFV